MVTYKINQPKKKIYTYIYFIDTPRESSKT